MAAISTLAPMMGHFCGHIIQVHLFIHRLQSVPMDHSYFSSVIGINGEVYNTNDMRSLVTLADVAPTSQPSQEATI